LILKRFFLKRKNIQIKKRGFLFINLNDKVLKKMEKGILKEE